MKDHFVLKSKSSYFCTKLYILTKSRMLTLNMRIVFSIFSLKKPKKNILGSKFKVSYFCIKLFILTHLRVVISSITIIFSNFQSKNNQKELSCSQIQGFLFLRKTLQFDKPECAHFNYNNIFFKYQPKYPKKHFSRTFKDFYP